jgi:hypothetical protein
LRFIAGWEFKLKFPLETIAIEAAQADTPIAFFHAFELLKLFD